MSNNDNKITKSLLNKVFLRNIFGLQLGWNYEKMQGLGYAYVIMPVLRVLYKNNPEKMKKAVQTHLAFFNTTPAMSNLIVGANIAIEEEGIEDPEAIIGLKTGLMGPFAGVGDTIFIAIYRAVVFSIASYMALAGNTMGLVIPLITGAGVIFVRYKFTQIGYQQGKKVASEMGGQIKMLTEGAAILGLTVVGALVPSVIRYTVDWKYTMNDVTISFQSMLDRILPSLLPLCIVLLSYWLLGRKKMNSTRLIFFLLGLGMLLGNLSKIMSTIIGIF